jgi:high affinity sulfate transporter 1
VLGLPVLQGVLPLGPDGLAPEIVAGMTLAALGIPEVMGYARIAGMPVVTGLYTILIPIAIFALLGSSRHLVVGADSATAAIMAAGLGGLAVAGSADYVGLAGVLALVTAGILVLARLCRLGFVADFLSRAVLIGFLTGVGIQVAIGQVAGMLGVSDGSGGTLRKFVNTLGAIPDASGATIATSSCVIAAIVGLRYVSPRIPGALIAVVGSIAVSWAFDLASHGVSDLGTVPDGLPSIGLPDASMHDFTSLVGIALSMVVVIVAQSAATSRAYAARYTEKLDENLDIVGLGLANVGAGLSGTFVVNGSPTKTEIVDSAGGRTQLATLTTAGVVLVVLLFLTEPLQYLPNAVLAAVVFLIGIELVNIVGLRKIYDTGHVLEFGIAALTAGTVVAWGVEQGIVLAIVLSILAHLRHSYDPHNAVLDVGNRWVGLPVDSVPQPAPGLIVYRWGASLYFANAARFQEQVLALVDSAGPRVSWFCVDAAGIGDVDYTGGETLLETNAELKEQGVRLVFAGVYEGVRRELTRGGVTAAVGEDAFFARARDVVAAYAGAHS